MCNGRKTHEHKRDGTERRDADPEQIQREIEQTREQLGDTVEALAAKTDVKARAQETAADLRQRAKDTTSQVRRQAVTAGETGRARVSEVAAPLRDATPDSVKQAVSKGTAGAPAVSQAAGYRGCRPGGRRGRGAVVDPAMIKVLYKPVSIVISVLGGILAGAIFKRIWKIAAEKTRPLRRPTRGGAGGRS